MFNKLCLFFFKLIYFLRNLSTYREAQTQDPLQFLLLLSWLVLLPFDSKWKNRTLRLSRSGSESPYSLLDFGRVSFPSPSSSPCFRAREGPSHTGSHWDDSLESKSSLHCEVHRDPQPRLYVRLLSSPWPTARVFSLACSKLLGLCL